MTAADLTSLGGQGCCLSTRQRGSGRITPEEGRSPLSVEPSQMEKAAAEEAARRSASQRLEDEYDLQRWNEQETP